MNSIHDPAHDSLVANVEAEYNEWEEQHASGPDATELECLAEAEATLD